MLFLVDKKLLKINERTFDGHEYYHGGEERQRYYTHVGDREVVGLIIEEPVIMRQSLKYNPVEVNGSSCH